MTFEQWAKKWGVSSAAIEDLHRNTFAIYGQAYADIPAPRGLKEEHVCAFERLQASREGRALWRNNVGALIDKNGRQVRFGLCNDSQKLNSVLKSSDYIGINPVRITPEMVGTIIGQFDAVECKEPGWVYSGTAHEVAQLAFINLVTGMGGRARFSTRVSK